MSGGGRRITGTGGEGAAIGQLLAQLEAAVRERSPQAAARLHPGLSEGEIAEVAEPLLPRRLPDDVIELYRWHDGFEPGGGLGAPEPMTLFFDADFPSLAESVDTYTRLVNTTDADPWSWSPAWFPALATSHSGEIVTLEPRRSPDAGLLWSFHNSDGWLSPSYDSVTSLVTVTATLWKRGLHPLPPIGEVNSYRAALREARRTIAAANPVCFPPAERTGRDDEVSFYGDGWLPEWRRDEPDGGGAGSS